MARLVSFGKGAARGFGSATLGVGALVALGAAPSLAQVSSSVTFNYIDELGPNNTSINTPDPADRRNGTVTFNGTGAPSAPTGSDFFNGITGIQFLDPFTFAYSGAPGSSVASYSSFSQFYFLGNCSICNNNPDSLITVPNSTGNILTSNVPGVGSAVTLSGGPIPIRFGETGHSGTITFAAQNLIATNNTIGGGSGFISFDVIDGPERVPGPLPILGASTAFAFSRKLRKRMASAQPVSPSA